MIEYAENLKMYFPTKSMEEIIHLLVDIYDESVFWEELAHNMAEKDFHKKYGEELIEQMTMKKRFLLIQEFVEKYIKEFEANGIENMVIKKGK